MVLGQHSAYLLQEESSEIQPETVIDKVSPNA